MTFLHIAIKDLRIQACDRNTLLLGLLLPVALTAIMGFAFSSDSGISEIRMTLVGPEGAELLTDAAAGMLSKVELFDVDITDEETAIERVRDGRRAAAIVIPDSLVRAAIDGTPAEFLVYEDPASSVKSRIVRTMAEQLAAYASTGSALGRSIYLTIDEEQPLSDEERLALSGWLVQWSYDRWKHPPLALEATDESVREISPVSYFAPAFAVFFLLFTLLASARSIHEEREAGTYERLRSTPVTRSSIIAGKMVGIYVLGAVQILVLIGLAHLLFGIDWGGSPLAVIVMALVTAAGAAAIAIFIAAVSKTGRQTDQIGTVVVLVMSIAGGSWWPIPQSFESISRLTFNYWAQKGFSNLVVHDTGFPGIAIPVAVVLSLATLLYGLSVLMLRRN